jgi:hypothetical protein
MWQKLNKFRNKNAAVYFILRPLWRNSKLPNKKPSALQKEHPTLQNMKILFFFILGSFWPFWVWTLTDFVRSVWYPLHVLFKMTDWPKHNHCQNIFLGMDRWPQEINEVEIRRKKYKSAVNILWKEDTCTLVKKTYAYYTSQREIWRELRSGTLFELLPWWQNIVGSNQALANPGLSVYSTFKPSKPNLSPYYAGAA